MWKYYDKNIGTDRMVAEFYNDNGKAILIVYEGKHSHYTVPYYRFISEYKISYATEAELAAHTISWDDNIQEKLKKRLIAGCKEIEKDYQEQVKKIREVIG